MSFEKQHEQKQKKEEKKQGGALALSDFSKQIAKPCFVKFGASWCGPCKRFAPTYRDFARRNSHQMNFLEVDVDEHTAIMEYIKTMKDSESKGHISIKSVPALLLFCKGKHVCTVTEYNVKAMCEASETHLKIALKA
jgi:thiol-disulfide isomerase/thioredoxin